MALIAYRTSNSESTGDSPFYLTYGREPWLSIDLRLVPQRELVTSLLEHHHHIVQNAERARQITSENNLRVQQKMKQYYDKNAVDPPFTEGERVWVYTPKHKPSLSKKFRHNWHGPYRVIRKCCPVHCKLRTIDNKQVSTMIHANRMKRFFDPDNRPINPPDEDVRGELLFEEGGLPLDSIEKGQQPILSEPQEPDPIQDEAPMLTENQPATDNQTVYAAEKVLDKQTNDSEAKENLLDPRLLEQFHNTRH